MAKNTTTIAKTEPVEALTVDTAEENMAEATTALVEALDPRKGIFMSCQESYNYQRLGLDLKVLAKRVSDAIIARDFPGADEDHPLVIAARKKGVIEGGANVTERSLKNRAAAWEFVVEVAQVEATPANIATAFKITSVGRGRTLLEEAAKPKFEASDLTGDERAKFADEVLEDTRIKMRSSSPRSAANRAAAAFQFDNVLKFLKELPKQAYTNDQIEALGEALQQADAELAGRIETAE